MGSASPQLVQGVSESLAGRIGLVDLGGFDLGETGPDQWRTLWERGGFPRAFLARSTSASSLWRRNFVRTFLERDIPRLGITIPAESLRRFWTMIAHYHGQTWNAAEFARSLGSSEGTARRYLDTLAGAFMVRVLPSWFENLKKRQVKAPKVYVRDTGLLHTLLGIPAEDQLLGHPKVGASFEGFECKFADAPGTTRSMRVALEDLGLEHLWVVYPGDEGYVLDDRISALPVAEIGPLTESMMRPAGW